MKPLLLSQYLVLHAHVIELRLQHVDAQLTRNIGTRITSTDELGDSLSFASSRPRVSIALVYCRLNQRTHGFGSFLSLIYGSLENGHLYRDTHLRRSCYILNVD